MVSSDCNDRSFREHLKRQLNDKQTVLIIIIGSFIYAVLDTIGEEIENSNELIIHDFLCSLPIKLFLSFTLLTMITTALPFFLKRRRHLIQKTSYCSTLKVFFLLLLCWLPMFLIEYPGSFMYDTQRQAFQIATGHYDAFHPLLHTLLLRLCLSVYPLVQSIEKCAVLYSILQMLLLAGCFALTCKILNQIIRNRSFYTTCVLFYGLYPAHMAMACNYIKDVLFAGLFSLYVALNLKQSLTQDNKKFTLVWIIICGSLVCLLRNNMIYAMALWAIILLFAKHKRRFLSAVLSINLACSVNEAMIFSLRAERGSIVEMLSVPIQQLSRVRILMPDSFSEQEKVVFDSVFTNEGWRNYEPTLSDPVKADISEEKLIENKSALAHLCFSIGLRNPKAYFDALFHLILPSIYPYRNYNVAQPYIETGLQPGVLTAPFGQQQMKQPSRFKRIREWLNVEIYSTGANHIPVLRWIMNSGLVFWFLFLCLLIVFLYGGVSRYTLLLALCLYGTYLLGPVMQGRYLYPFVCVIPHFIMSAVIAAKGEKEYAQS